MKFVEIKLLNTSKHTIDIHQSKCHVTNSKTADFNPVRIFHYEFHFGLNF